MKKNFLLFLFALLIVALPDIAYAAEETKSALHLFYERTFGPVGAIAGIIAMVVLWQLTKKSDTNLSYALKLFVFVLIFINIGSISFGIHGAGLIDGETSRYVERICRLIALLSADVAALMLYVKLNKKKEEKPEIRN